MVMAEEHNKYNVFTRALRRCANGISIMLCLPIRIYQRCISPLLPASCRFTPTCSEYAIQAIMKYGPAKGMGLAIWRLLRCNPWGGHGYDPVP